jgi:hypothetical protein
MTTSFRRWWTRTDMACGFPALVISPYAKKGYIDHQILSFDAYNKFVEDDFLHGARLNPRTDGRADPRPNVRENARVLGNLVKDFNFKQRPKRVLILPVHPRPGPASAPELADAGPFEVTRPRRADPALLMPGDSDRVAKARADQITCEHVGCGPRRKLPALAQEQRM